VVNGQEGVSRRTLLKGAALGAAALVLKGTGLASAAESVVLSPWGRKSYVIPSLAEGVTIVPLLTTGEAAENGYRMVGIPDGLGLYIEQNKIIVLMHHELPANAGILRAHGSKGSFVSRWTIEPLSMRMLEGRDLTPSPDKVHLWNAGGGYSAGTTAWNRFCSADLPLESAFQFGNLGTPDRIFLGGEESDDGQAWARIATGPQEGEAWQLPRLGRMAFENAVACPFGKERTIVLCLDDSDLSTAPSATGFPSEVYVYIGNKQASGNAIERAGLTNGKLYGIRVARNDGSPVTEESNSFGFGNKTTDYIGMGRFGLVELGPNGDVSTLSARELEDESVRKDVMRFQRSEDGCWDPREAHKNDFYFVTTASLSRGSNSRLWRLRFDDLDNPLKGGTIEILLKGGEGQRMFDNIGMDRLGRIMLQEDTGNNPWLAKIWCYSVDNGRFFEVATHDPAQFEPSDPLKSTLITQDEESSGIIDASGALGPGWFLFDVQNHKSSSDPELVQGGQLLAMWVDPRLGITL